MHTMDMGGDTMQYPVSVNRGFNEQQIMESFFPEKQIYYHCVLFSYISDALTLLLISYSIHSVQCGVSFCLFNQNVSYV